MKILEDIAVFIVAAIFYCAVIALLYWGFTTDITITLISLLIFAVLLSAARRG
jgi:hypothetical protein